MRRRIMTYDGNLIGDQVIFRLFNLDFHPIDVYQFIMTIVAFTIALSILIFFINFFRSIKNGEKADGNVWNSRSPEWQVPSPMPVHNYDQAFEVVGEPYDYGLADAPYVKFSTSKSKSH
jgi:cytochrome c oxidase subunit 1